MHLLLVGILHLGLGLWLLRQRRTIDYVYAALVILVGVPFVWLGGEALMLEIAAMSPAPEALLASK